MRRGFTFIDDAVEGILRLVDHPAEGNPDWQAEDPDPASSSAPYRVYNMGTSEPVELSLFVELLETALGRTANKQMAPIQPGDVPATSADLSSLVEAVDPLPCTPLAEGIRHFVSWYGQYHQVEGIPVA